MDLKSTIRTIPNWPKPGIMFRDITTLLKDPEAWKETLSQLVQRYKNAQPKIDVVVGIEARGFILGGALAEQLGVGFVPMRKLGKLPAETISEEYDLEYGKDHVELHRDAIAPGQNILVVDDLIATGGTCIAACNLITKLGGKVSECAFVIDLPDIGGRKKLKEAGFNSFALMAFEGD
jgi:adenine phosphoribosyltransferase